MNQFLQKARSHDALTENLAVSHSTSQDPLVDYFFNAGNNRGRAEYEVAGDLASIFSVDPLQALKLVFYNRMISRKENSVDTVQMGQGQKDEFIKSLAWLENNYPDLVRKNLHLVPRVGCWKDLWYDSANTGYYYYVNKEWAFPIIRDAIITKDDLLAKYLPKIRSSCNVKTERHRRLNKWAIQLCHYLDWTPKHYRKFKSRPENVSFEFQRQMCRGDWDKLEFHKISGKALFNLVSRTGKDKLSTLERHRLIDRYVEWIKEQPVAKFTGYVYELYKAANKKCNLAQKYTFDAQFNQLIEQAKQGDKGLSGNIWCALDTSGSMEVQCAPNLRAIDVCVSLGIFFSTLNEGAFKDCVVMFDERSKILKLTGGFCDKVDQIKASAIAWGCTNFQSVIDEIVRVRQQNPGIPVSDFPTTLLVVSDMQFNSTGSSETNYETAVRKLNSVGLPDISVIWWNVNSNYGRDYPTQIQDRGTTLISGFDPTIIQLILGGDKKERKALTPLDQMNKALDQELLNQLVL